MRRGGELFCGRHLAESQRKYGRWDEASGKVVDMTTEVLHNGLAEAKIRSEKVLKGQVRRGVVHYSAVYYDDICVALGRDPTPSDKCYA